MDLVISAGALARARDKTFLLDVTVSNPAAVSHIAAHSDSTAGVAAAAGEKSKRTKFVVAHGLVCCSASRARLARHRPVAQRTRLQRLSVALQRALLHRERAYIDKPRERGILPPATCAAECLWDVQLSGTRLPTWAF
jgi:hypothetical protein